MKTKKLWIIVPAYNEGKRIEDVLEGVKNYSKNVVVVDDGSRDGTSKLAKKHDVLVLKHLVNLGKGAALKTGCEYAIRKRAEKLIAIDADGQHDPEEIPNFLEALESADVVFGYRKLNKKMPLLFRIGNMLINFTTKILYNVKLRDTQGGYRAFTADAYKKLRWKSNDYSMESEMIANMGKHHLRYKEIPIKTIYSEKYKGTTVLDGIKIVVNMFIWRLRK